MKYVYRNIDSGTVILIKNDNVPKGEGTITLHKCFLTNTHSGTCTVDLYLEDVNIAETEKLYGEDSNYDDVLRDYVTKVSDKYYFRKGTTIDQGASLSLFEEHPCTHDAHFRLVVVSNGSLSIMVDYEPLIFGTASSSIRSQQPNAGY